MYNLLAPAVRSVNHWRESWLVFIDTRITASSSPSARLTGLVNLSCSIASVLNLNHLYDQLVNKQAEVKDAITGNSTYLPCFAHVKKIHRWYSSRHDRSLSMLHCVMESDTQCAAPVLALSTQSDSWDKSNLWDSHRLTEEPSHCISEARCCRTVDLLFDVGGFSLPVCRCLGLQKLPVLGSALTFLDFPCTIVGIYKWPHVLNIYKTWKFNQNVSRFYPNCLHGVICLHSKVQLLDNSWKLVSEEQQGTCCTSVWHSERLTQCWPPFLIGMLLFNKFDVLVSL